MKIIDFKKFIETKPTLELIGYTINDVETSHPYKNKARKVTICNTVGFALDSNGKDSSTNWPKVADLTVCYDTQNRMIITKKFGHVELKYRHVPDTTIPTMEK